MDKLKRKRCMLMRGIVAVILMAACVLSMALPACAAANAPQKRTVKVGAFTSSGYHEKNADGSIGGYGYEYETLLAQYADWNLTYVEGNWPQLQQMLADGEIDLLGFLVSTPERHEIYDYADYPSGQSTSCLIAAKDNAKYAYDDFEAFHGMRVAYQEKNANIDSVLEWCAREGFEIEALPCNNYEELTEAIDSGRADAGLANDFYDISEYKIISNINSVEYFYAVKKGNSQLFEELNAAVKKIATYYPNLHATMYSHFYKSENSRLESFTAEEYDYLETHPTVTVLAGGRGAPFEIWEEDTQTYTGFVPDVLGQITALTGLEFQYQNVEQNRVYAAEHTGENIISPMTCDPIWAYQNGWKITQPFLEAEVSIVKKDEAAEIETVGLAHENYLKRHIEQYHPGWTVQTYNTMEERLDAVFNGICDAALMNSYEADYYLSAGKYHLLYETIATDISQSIGFGVSQGSDPLLFSILSKAIFMVGSDTYTALMHDNLKYDGKNDLVSLMYTNPEQILLVSVVLVLLLTVVFFLVLYTISIRRKNKEVMAATQVKTDFFSRMSHDMRTPMNGILGMTELSKAEQNPAVLHHNLEQIETSGRYMLQLINDTLEIQKLETGKMKLEMQEVYVKEYITALVEMMQPTAQEKGIQFRFENRNINLEQNVECDPTRIKQAFVNLLSNAMKFTPEGGTVCFTAECIATENGIDHDRFLIQDTGIGMSEDFIKNRIFKPYSQEDSSITSRYGGTGLGLAIAKNIVEAMGGSIAVESTVGEGTCFTVLLDFKTLPVTNKTAMAKEPFADGANLSVLQGKRILLCEDHPLNAEIAKRLLQKVGCDIVLASDGKIGVELFCASDAHGFDAVLMDVRMPNMDGLTATKTIRSLNRPDAATVPILAMTANAFDEDIRHCKEAGMNAHLAKPIDPQKLYEELANYISKSIYRKANQ